MTTLQSMRPSFGHILFGRERRARNCYAVLAPTMALAVCCADPGGSVRADGGAPTQVDYRVHFSITEAGALVFHQVLESAALLDPTRVVVGMMSTNQLVYLDDRGTPRAVRGGTGEGPGEFRALRAVIGAGDTIIAWDRELRRATLFSAAGDHLVDVSISGQQPILVGAIPGVGVVTAPFRRSEGTPRRYTIWNPTGSIAGVLAGRLEYPNPVLRTDAGNATRRVTLSAGGGCLPVLLDAVLGATIYVADTGRGEIHALELNGSQRMVYRTATRALVTNEMFERLEVILDRAAARGAEQMIGRPGETLASAWSTMIADATGRLWLKQADCFTRPEEHLWEVIDTAGNLVGVVSIAGDLEVIAARGEQVVVIRRDSLQVEHVELHTIRVANGAQPVGELRHEQP